MVNASVDLDDMIGMKERKVSHATAKYIVIQYLRSRRLRGLGEISLRTNESSLSRCSNYYG
jgi:hypothetical protein